MERALTYRLDGLNEAVISAPSRPLRLEAPRGESSAGDMDALPLELCHDVLLRLDLQSVAAFRTASARCMWTVDALPEYGALAAHAPGALYALVSTRIARHATLRALYGALCTPACAVCGAFGALLYLPELRRCCVRCLVLSTALMPTLAVDVERRFGVAAAALAARVPVVCTVPGSYAGARLGVHTLVRAPQETRLSFVSIARVEAALTAARDGGEGRLSPGLGRYGCKRALMVPGHRYRFMCAAPFPYLDRATGVVDLGVCCRGCKAAQGSEDTAAAQGEMPWNGQLEEMYSAAGFEEHFKSCTRAQELWESLKS